MKTKSKCILIGILLTLTLAGCNKESSSVTPATEAVSETIAETTVTDVTTSVTIAETEAKVESEVKLIPYTFNESIWGMSKQEILVTTNPVLGEPVTSDANSLTYANVDLEGLCSSNLMFCFDNEDYLYRIEYTNTDNNENKNDYIISYDLLKQAYTELYGAPPLDFVDWTNETYKNDPDNYGQAIAEGYLTFASNWLISDNSKIYMRLRSKDGVCNHTVIYFQPNYAPVLEYDPWEE